ncbi:MULTISPECIES: tRNA (guanosine(37)-N1)-methyltransferase TrmD [Corynebacterium]|uniref:tRNA (guanine-N(1)-)-methyltransferase n=1 Tax=Corynebacterium glucuronolyticum TaxID=39791 RepID=A0A7T4EHY4_9CORY|nr:MULTISPECIES: tRNA (guanosine(37)-N1)-methyltransferase TrmD [Corynebacterium]EEI26813.1 tRNA (guanine-N(1)-)-methyltransferase [Corynebacterium glucuronolyticum ATCC 51867]MCT1441155.1 tRNA (guanosine(37)-N1)-methyltransferase TrmD [Corynebacterium glucuronolyticum]MCT1562201.1 tRNA (guanosine(37)-N1)-methyltransferase TrmD [Corynebacterium glucuronolyticum]OFO43702.1 tRNA (guanine(37)-N(1))-methyltransferase [Corynebacterium sp. HMSC073D01]QQB47720.1 tRNA (guanosine(37)-N1)-methyltransfer
MKIDVITIFPEYLDPLRHALLGKAIENGQLSVGVHYLRDWASGVHQAVDDSPYGGGPGMVMMPTVWGAALEDVVAGKAAGDELQSAELHRGQARHDEVHDIESRGYSAEALRDANDDRPLLIVPTPSGTPFTQEMARRWSNEEHVIFACGRYEGIDQRVIDDAHRYARVEEVSIGDYVLIGGEVAVLVMAEAMVRLIPGVLGNSESHEDDSFSHGLLEGPSYTKPRVWRGMEVPEPLTSGNHKRIAKFHHDEAVKKTARVRPDIFHHLMETGELSKEDIRLGASQYPMRTRMQVLVREKEMNEALDRLAVHLAAYNIYVTEVQSNPVSLACDPSHSLLDEFERTHDRSAISEEVFTLEILTESLAPAKNLTSAVMELFEPGTPWMGTTVAREDDEGLTPADPNACAVSFD